MRSVGRGLVKLKDAGVVNWLRRCMENWVDGRFTLRQQTNAYAVLPRRNGAATARQPPAPPPDPGTWGDPAPVPGAIEQAIIASRDGAGLKERIALLQSDESDDSALALARLGKLLGEAKP